MKLISPSIEIWEQTDFSMQGIKKHIEKCGRVCYKSEDKITDDSYESFFQMLVNRGHTAMLEHGTVFIKQPTGSINTEFLFLNNPYSKINRYSGIDFITTNMRVIEESNDYDILYAMSERPINFAKRITVKLVCSRAVAQQLTRHRKFSFAMESQRYCNYNNDKFGNEITFIMPQWYENTKYYDYHLLKEFEETLASIEKLYMFYISKGLKPQEARAILPNVTKTELVMTGFIEDWEYLFKLRCSDSKLGKPDPETSYLADKIRKEFINRLYIKQ